MRSLSHFVMLFLCEVCVFVIKKRNYGAKFCPEGFGLSVRICTRKRARAHTGTRAHTHTHTHTHKYIDNAQPNRLIRIGDLGRETP